MAFCKYILGAPMKNDEEESEMKPGNDKNKDCAACVVGLLKDLISRNDELEETLTTVLDCLREADRRCEGLQRSGLSLQKRKTQ